MNVSDPDNSTISSHSNIAKGDPMFANSINFDRIEEISYTGSFTWNLHEDHLICSKNFLKILEFENHTPSIKKDDFFGLIQPDALNLVLDVMHECMLSNDKFEISFSIKKNNRKIRLFGYPQGTWNRPVLIGFIQDLAQLSDSSQALLSGQDEERKRISLELHDSVGQKLIAAKYQVAITKHTPENTSFDKLNNLLNQIIEEIRTITHNLSSQMVSEVGLRNAVGQLLSETSHYLQATKTYEYELKNSTNQDIQLKEDVAKMIYRIIQEALSNCMKHSEASHVYVGLKIINKQILVTIEDNGKGFQSETTLSSGIGLRNIRERVALLNGFIKIRGTKDEGVKIQIKIPEKDVISM